MTRIEDAPEGLDTLSPAPVLVGGRFVRIFGSGPSPARVRVALLVVVVVFVALGSFVAAKTPAWESSDEPGHVLNIETLVSGHWYGFDQNCRPDPRYTILSCEGDEAEQPPLYYMVMAGWQDLAGLSAHNPPTRLTFNNDEAAQPFFLTHTADWDLLLWLRVGNVLIGAATVLMAFLVARLVARDKWTPVIAAALIAFLPRFVFLSSFVTNDNLVIFLGAVLTFCALRFSRSRTTPWMVVTGVVFGLLLVTKLTIAPLTLLLPLLAVIGGLTWRRRLSLLAYGCLSALAVSAWYLIQNWVRYGDPTAGHAELTYLTNLGALGTPPGVPYVIKNPANLVIFDVPNRIVSNIWYSAGWGQFHWPQAVAFLIAIVVALSLLGLIYQKFPPRVLLILGAIAILSLACMWFMAFQTPSYGVRYGLVGVSAMATLLALAVQPWPLVLRWVLPLAGFAGCLVAIQQNVLGVHWS